jgi:hypothetical protein
VLIRIRSSSADHTALVLADKAFCFCFGPFFVASGVAVGKTFSLSAEDGGEDMPVARDGFCSCVSDSAHQELANDSQTNREATEQPARSFWLRFMDVADLVEALAFLAGKWTDLINRTTLAWHPNAP